MNVTILSGGKESGKTTALIHHYREGGSGEGFASVKAVERGATVGFDCMRLSDGTLAPLARFVDNIPADWEEHLTLGRFSFSRRGFAFAGEVINAAIAGGKTPVFIDEVGKLELSGRGFHELVTTALGSGLDVVLCVRDINVDPVIDFYSISNPSIIRL